MDKIYKDAIIQKLHNKGVKNPCPLCQSLNFELVGKSSVMMDINDEKKGFLGHYSSVLVACSNCGYVMQFILSVLET